MKKISKIVGGFALTMSLNAQAGLHWTTAASRANCINNESVTWNARESFVWKTISIHKWVRTDEAHLVDTGWNYTWRSVAVHWLRLVM